jgi:hypothetical protein
MTAPIQPVWLEYLPNGAQYSEAGFFTGAPLSDHLPRAWMLRLPSADIMRRWKCWVLRLERQCVS